MSRAGPHRQFAGCPASMHARNLAYSVRRAISLLISFLRPSVKAALSEERTISEIFKGNTCLLECREPATGERETLRLQGLHHDFGHHEHSRGRPNLRLRRKSRQVSPEGGESSEASTARVSAPDRSQGQAPPGGCSAAADQGAEWFGSRCQPRRNVRRAERASEEHSESEVSKRQLRPSCRNCLGAVLEAAES